jgi:N6-adenosine-specific RNA methylase IME4
VTDPFVDLPRGHYGAILADAPWCFESWSDKGTKRSADRHYSTMTIRQIARLPVDELAAKDCVLFMWITWPVLLEAIHVIKCWGFDYRTCGFDWMKADPYRLFVEPTIGMGYWTRSNTEPCLLATRGKPKRLNADVRQAIIAPRREHSRKPDGIHERIERLVAGPYLELFAREQRPGWDCWGDQTTMFNQAVEVAL